LPVGAVQPNAIQTTAPAVPATQTGPVIVQVAEKVIAGPALVVQSETQPIPPPVVTSAAVAGKAAGQNVGQLQTGQAYSLTQPAGVTVTFSRITPDEQPQPPGPLTVTGYQPASVPQGTAFVILGTGFSAPGTLRAAWGSMPLAVTLVNDTQLGAQAPAGASGSNPVTVTVGDQTAAGPALPITSDGGGGNGGIDTGEIVVKLTTKPRAYGNQLVVFAYTADPAGNSFPASVNGRVTGPSGNVDLWGQTTHGLNGPATWSISRPAPWGTPCDVVVHAFSGGKTGTGRAQG
jgi:hypothetical protein